MTTRWCTLPGAVRFLSTGRSMSGIIWPTVSPALKTIRFWKCCCISPFPQRNTALLSESLMERFGSLHGVLSAGVDLLMAVDGMTRHAAVLLDMVLQAAQRAIEEQNSVNDLLNTDEKVGGVFAAQVLWADD